MNRHLFRTLGIVAISGIVGIPVLCIRAAWEHVRSLWR